MSAYSKIKVLIADDERQFASRMTRFLNESGFDCRFASSGSETKEILQEWKPRFVLCDLMLPENNAFELIKFIKSKQELVDSATQLMVVSGHNDSANVRKSFDMGAYDYIVKPIKPETLLDRLVFGPD